MCIDAPCVSAKGGEWVSEGEKMQSSACLSGHAIQHREKPFIQQSLPTPASKLPSNSVRAEWTRWQGSAALSPPSTLFSPRTCLFFTASSSFSFCLPYSPQKHQHFFFSFCVFILAHSLLCPPCSQLFISACHPSP